MRDVNPQKMEGCEFINKKMDGCENMPNAMNKVRTARIGYDIFIRV